MYWPSPEECDVSFCEGSDNGTGRCGTDRRSVCQSLSELMNTTTQSETPASAIDQFSTSDSCRPEVTEKWTPSSASGGLEPVSQSSRSGNTMDDVTDLQTNFLSAPE